MPLAVDVQVHSNEQQSDTPSVADAQVRSEQPPLLPVKIRPKISQESQPQTCCQLKLYRQLR